MRVLLHGQPVDLPHDSFVADGGEAAVYARGDVAYKVFHQPCDPARLRALAQLPVPGALLPAHLLHDDKGQCIGHTMAYLGGAVPWARLLARSYCDRHGIDGAALLTLVGLLRDRVHAVHRAGALVVDLHEGNVLLDPAHTEPVLIDTSSWQLPGFPATAIQDGIRDRHARGFDQGTDWFAFAVLTLHLLLGIHPYRGTHPTVKGLDARMTARLSVLQPTVRRPAVCRPDDVLPGPWRRWYGAVLDGDHRGPPPAGPVDAITWCPTPTATARRLVLTPILQADEPLHGVVDRAGTTVGRGAKHLFTPAGRQALPAEHAVVTADGAAVAAWREGGALQLWDLGRGVAIPSLLRADALGVAGHRLVVRSGARLLELCWQRAGDRLHAMPHLLATVLPAATQLFHGVAVENLLGRTHLRLLGPGRCDTHAVPFLDGWQVLDAQHHGGVVALLARRAGQTDRWVLRTGRGRLDTRHTADVEVADMDLVRLGTGVCLLRVGQRLELFRDRPGDDQVKTLEDPILGEARLVPLDGAVGLVHGRQLHRAELR